MDVPDKVLKDIRCSHCEQTLSIFPVHTYENGRYVCGRCEPEEGSKPFRDTAYESLAKDLSFPCIYKPNGCIEKLTPDELVAHEPNCHYKSWGCPCPDGCDWKGMSIKMPHHFGDQHPGNMIEENGGALVVNTEDKPGEGCYLIEALNQVFVVLTKTTKTEVFVDVRFVGLKRFSDRYEYRLTVGSNGKAPNVKRPKMPVRWDVSLNNRVDGEVAQTIIYEEVKQHGNKLQFKVSITRAKTEIPKPIDEITQLNETILRRLECPVCMEHMVPPIYQCTNGHMLCDNCKKKVPTCPSCKLAVGNTRNRILEDITADIFYRCTFDGCLHTYKATDKQNHVAECRFAPYTCPFASCGFSDSFTKTLAHIDSGHTEQLVGLDTVNAYFNEGVEDLYVLKKSGCLFTVRQKCDKEDFFLSVAFYGPREVANNFYYIVDVRKDDDGASERVYAKFKCSEPSEAPYTDGFLQVPISLLDTFKDDIHVPYKIIVVEE